MAREQGPTEVPAEYRVARYAAEARVLRRAFMQLAEENGVNSVYLAYLVQQATGNSLTDLQSEGRRARRRKVVTVTGTSREGVDLGVMASTLTRVGGDLAIEALTQGGLK